MKYIIFLILIAAVIAFLIMSYEGKLFKLKRQLLIANNQIERLRKQVPKNSTYKKGKSSEIIFEVPSSTMGIINENTNVLLSPLYNSDIVRVTTVKMEVKILDKAILNNINWYYISLPMDTNINCRGWVNQECFSYFYGDSSDLAKN